jgi:hypothetical protein
MMTVKKYLALAGIVSVIGLSAAGCGSSQEATVATPHSAAKRVHHAHVKRLRVKGAVSQVSVSQDKVKNRKGKILTEILGTHTKYRQKKVTITLSKITAASTVIVTYKKISGRDTASLVRLVPT